MSRSLVPRFHAILDFSGFDDTNRHQLSVGIEAGAATSALVAANPAMQTSVAAMTKKDAALTAATAVVVTDKQKLRADIAAETEARSALDNEIRTFVILAESYATSPTDLQGVALVYRAPTPVTKVPPPAPTTINTIFPKVGHGKATASVYEVGPTRLHYVAQWSPDPFGPTTWAQLGVGQGKTRVVTGASGTRIWVRFAQVRGQLQSDWSVPVLITLP